VSTASNAYSKLVSIVAAFALAGCASVPPPVAPRPATVEWPAIPEGKVAIRAAVIECAAPTAQVGVRSLDVQETLLLAGREARVLSLPIALAKLGSPATFQFEEPASSEPLAHG
jgi:hypothetical protein